MRRAVAAALLALISAIAARAAPAPIPGKFDYYLLALSWSPSFCASAGAARREPLQCGATRRGFILHGLWPQYEHGWPSHCASALTRDVPIDLQRRQLDLTPSAKLVVHEWQTHGLCTGLNQDAYFTTARRMRAKVVVPMALAAPAQTLNSTPAAVRAALMKANPGLRADGLAISCDKGRLDDVRICFTKDGVFRRCGADVRDRCLPGALKLPASGAR